MAKERYLVSACLAGVCSRFDGQGHPHKHIIELIGQGVALPVCPEQLGGLTTPRPPAEIVGGTGMDLWAGRARVMTAAGTDVTAQFIKGAQETLKLGELFGAHKAILKAKSPSCGPSLIYNGTFQGQLTPGMGVTAALLHKAGWQIYSEDDLFQLIDQSSRS
ncbi:MAG: DUF523 domain-containing protein [Limnochordia bacterium]